MMMKSSKCLLSLVTAVVVLLLLTACSREETPEAAPASATKTHEVPSVPAAALPPTTPLLVESLPVHQFEVPGAALSVWRKYAAARPTLLLLSSDPMLVPVPAPLRDEVRAWIDSASADELARRSRPDQADVLLQPIMAVDAALRQGLFSKVDWVLPVRSSEAGFQPERYLEKFRQSTQFSADEVAGMTASPEGIQGRVRGVPLRIAPLADLPAVTGPVIVHVDLSYFQGMYKNEVSTPLLPLVLQVLQQLRERHLPVVAMTISSGNLEGRIGLDVRFLREVLAYYVENPELLTKKVPRRWQQLMQIYYLQEFIKREEAAAVAAKLDEENPGLAWVKFARYRVAVDQNEPKKALEYLAEAAKRDRIYAVEYMSLTTLAYRKQQLQAARNMLELAAKAFPENPHIQINIAELAREMGDNQTARHLAQALQKLPWSRVYYPKMAEFLEGLMSNAQKSAPSTAGK